MASYQVVIAPRTAQHRGRPRTLRVLADDPYEAFQFARLRLSMTGDVHDIAWLTVRRRGRRGSVSYAWPGSEPGDGGAGVREPRRPLPSPPTLRIAI